MRKLEAYTKILESLHYLRIEAEKNCDDELRFKDEESSTHYSPEYKAHLEEMKKVRIKAGAEMQKILDTI